MTDFLFTHWLDIVTTILGLIYLVLEYRASIALWVVGIVMPAMDIYLYWSHGLYGDAGMAVYYTLAAIYGYAVWKFGAKWKAMIKRKGSDKKEGASAVSSDKIEAANALDAFTNALSFVGLWALARKYVEQWLFWIAVDVVCCYLYVVKGIPFKAGLYGLYVVIAVMGYWKWKGLAKKAQV